MDYLRDRGIAGNIFNSSGIGGYLIWKIYPDKQVSLDGRWEVYGDFLENIQHLRNPYYFVQLTTKYNIQAIILYKGSWESQLMEPWLQRSPFWRESKNTTNAVVFERYNG